MTDLSGLAAILSDDGHSHAETRDLGPDPVVKMNTAEAAKLAPPVSKVEHKTSSYRGAV